MTESQLLNKEEFELAVVEKNPTPYITVPGGLPGEDPREKFKYLNILIHSPGGRGKTSLIASACRDPRTSPILVLDDEGGAPLRFVNEDPTKYTIRKIRSMNDINMIYEYLRKGEHPYKAVAMDSCTDLQKLGLWEFVYGTTPDKTFKGNVLDIKAAEIQHWGKSHNQMTMLMRYFRDLDLHVFFTTLSLTEKDETTGKITTKVALPGKQADEIPGIPDIVGYIDLVKTKDGQQRVLKVQPDGRIECKDRTDALGPGVILDQNGDNVTKILDLIWNKYGITEDMLRKPPTPEEDKSAGKKDKPATK